MRSGSRNNKLQIPRLIKPYTPKKDLPFEKFQHFVVAPPQQNDKSNLIKNNEPNSPIKNEISNYQSIESINLENNQILTRTQFEIVLNTDSIDNFIVEATKSTVHNSTENFLKKQFNATHVIFWIDLPENRILYSPTYLIKCPYGEGLPSASFYSRSLIKLTDPITHPNYSQLIDSKFTLQENPTILFPLWDHRNVLCAVIEIVRTNPQMQFNEEDCKFLGIFASKFKIFSSIILKKPLNEPILLELMQIQRNENLINLFSKKIIRYFNCKKCEIWKFDQKLNKIEEFNTQKTIDLNDSGIVGATILLPHPSNISSNKLHPSYNEKIDGKLEESLLIIPVEEINKRFLFAVVLRGPNDRILFTQEEENILQKMASFIILASTNSDKFTIIDDEYNKSQERRDSLASLLEIAEILSGQLDINKLTEIIMEKGRLLTQADRCSLFLVNNTRDRLITSFHRGLENSINLPIDKGIAGLTVSTGKVLNIPDAYKEPAFDQSTDLESGYRTRSILSIPIYNNRGLVIGVTEMINKLNNESFTEWDTHMIQIFNVFCGISLENAKLYTESVEMSQQLRSFFDVSFSLSKEESIQRILGDIIHNARQVIEAQCASLFLVDESAGLLISFLVDGGKVPATLPLKSGIVGACVNSKECLVVNNTYDDPRFNRAVDFGNGFKTDSLLVAPVLSSNGELLGVVEMVNKKSGEFIKKDVDLLRSFATFAAVSLENNRLKNIVELGTVEIEINKYILEQERPSFEIPIKLLLDNEQKKIITSLNFFSIEWIGLGQIKVLFSIFNRFNLLKTFNISNEMFFRFLFEIRSKYNNVPYHNWTHAVDVTQYIQYEIITSQMENKYSSLEILALCISAICHDVNHDGFNNVYNVKAETPLGILFKDQSVMETHHCNVTIQILSKDEFNLLHSLSSNDQKKVWNWIIKLILATDMAHHFKMVKDVGLLLDENNFNLENSEHKLYSLQLLLKVADISNVSRPFKIADKWCDVLMEEFFRQGDNEKAYGIGLTSPLNDRENPNKPKSQIGFYNFICIPLYQLISRIFPELNVNLQSVQNNLQIWKSMIEN